MKRNDFFTIIMNDLPLEDNNLDIDNDKLLLLYLHLILSLLIYI